MGERQPQMQVRSARSNMYSMSGSRTSPLATINLDGPKSLASCEERNARLAMLEAPHVVALTQFVNDVRAQMGGDYRIPYFDPLDGGTYAECLFLLEAPGPKAVTSGFVSRNNPDETAKNFFLLNRELAIERTRTVAWNI